jgi:transducin (beta)-like 1
VHTAPTLDVDWRDNTSFASCSGDATVAVFQLGETKPIRVFRGHKVRCNAACMHALILC